MPVIEIKHLAEERDGLFYHLTDAQLRSRQEPEKGVFIAEGPKVIGAALDAGLHPSSLLMRRKFLTTLGAEIIARCGDIPVYTADDDTLFELTGFRLQRSWVLAAIRRPAPRSAASVLNGAARVAVLEGITEPSNVGAIFRSAAALGMDAALLSSDCCDPLHRRAVRVCMGSIFRLPWARLEASTLEPLRANGFTTVGLALRADALTLDDARLRNHQKIALLLGTEDTGLKPETIEGCDYVARIPMAPGIDSLNVAAAAAVAFWQFRRPETDGSSGLQPNGYGQDTIKGGDCCA